MEATTRPHVPVLPETQTVPSREWSRLARHWGGRVLLYAIVIAGAVVFLFPLFWLVSSSLKPEGDIFEFPPNLNCALLGKRSAAEDANTTTALPRCFVLYILSAPNLSPAALSDLASLFTRLQ